MEIVEERCAGLDVHKETVVACVRTPGERPGRRGQEVRTFDTRSVGVEGVGVVAGVGGGEPYGDGSRPVCVAVGWVVEELDVEG